MMTLTPLIFIRLFVYCRHKDAFNASNKYTLDAIPFSDFDLNMCIERGSQET
jgi:hypothetical protein